MNKLNTEMYICYLEPPNKLNTEMYIWCLEPLNKLDTEMCIWCLEIRVITQLLNSEQSYKGKVKTHKYINRQISCHGKVKYHV